MLEIKKTEYRENVESFAIAVVTILFIIIFVIQSFLVSGTSMVPTLLDRERLIVNKYIYWFHTPQRGDVIVLKPPHDTRKYIKRVIGLPGDHIEIKNSKLYINYSVVDEPYINEKDIQDYPAIDVPYDTLFVLGDNRNYSKDSRDPDVGFIPMKNVVGRAIFIFWPLNKIKVLTEPKSLESKNY